MPRDSLDFLRQHLYAFNMIFLMCAYPQNSNLSTLVKVRYTALHYLIIFITPLHCPYVMPQLYNGNIMMYIHMI